MTPVVFGVRKNASIASIVEKMTCIEIRCLLVTDSDGALIGTTSIFDVLPHLTRRDAEHGFRETPARAAYPNGRSFSVGLAKRNTALI
jgi:hypothetical protein